MHKRILLFATVYFLEMVFLESLPTILGEKVQQSLSVDILWYIIVILVISG